MINEIYSDIEVGFIGWITYWIVYWVFGNIIPYDKKCDRYINPSLVPTVCKNMMYSLPYSLILWYFTPNLRPWLYFDNPIILYLLSVLIADFWFYFVHRLMHEKFYIYHKKHHEYVDTKPIVAVYCSITEALLCDVTSFGLGPSLFKFTSWEMFIWMIFASLHSLLLHSSFNYSRDHVTHHGKLYINYGLFCFADKLFGTYF